MQQPKDFEILDNMAEIIMIENETGILKYVNKAFCGCHGVTAEEAVGKSCFDFILPEDREVSHMEKVVTPENPYYRIEGRSKRADGTIIWLQYVGRAYFDDQGKLTEFQEIGVDITNWKKKIEDSARELIKTSKWINEMEPSVRGRQREQKSESDSRIFPALYRFSDIDTSSRKMKTLITYAKSVAAGDATILIEGESGTGKELFAQAIHNAGRRARGPFVAINCGAVPGELIGSEFFGYAEGAFTGASKGGKPGKFEMASGGTLFLDEIGEMPLKQQVALLRVLETRTVSRIGDIRQIPVDVRIICATNKSLYKEVKENRFRRDLYYRLNVIHLHIPPLRERKEDIAILMERFLEKHGASYFNLENIFTEERKKAFYEYDWPGNVRELQNVLERLLYMPNDGAGAGVLPVPLSKEVEREKAEQTEKAMLWRLMREYEGNISMVARKMQISRNTLYKKLRKYDIRNESKKLE